VATGVQRVSRAHGYGRQLGLGDEYRRAPKKPKTDWTRAQTHIEKSWLERLEARIKFRLFPFTL
jgi:hypothetical protein